MKTISQAAQEYFNKHSHRPSIMQAFEAGAYFAQKWISVEDELPHYGKFVLVKNTVKGIYTECFYGKFSKNITHWRLIELI